MPVKLQSQLEILTIKTVQNVKHFNKLLNRIPHFQIAPYKILQYKVKLLIYNKISLLSILFKRITLLKYRSQDNCIAKSNLIRNLKIRHLLENKLS